MHPARQRAPLGETLTTPDGVGITLHLVVARVERLWLASRMEGRSKNQAQRHHFIEDRSPDWRQTAAVEAAEMRSPEQGLRRA